jgi:hypothetical protein
MKIVFFILVIANVTLFAWELKTGALAGNESAPLGATTGPDAIVFLAENALKPIESKPAITPETQTPLVAPSPAQAVTACYEAGPFPQQEDFQHWLSALSVQYAVKPINKTRKTPKHFNVTTPLDSNKSTAENFNNLKQHGISDFYLHSSADGGKVISLGVFSTEMRAENLRAALVAKGIAASISIEYKIQNHKLLAIDTREKAAEILDGLQKTYPLIPVVASECQ